MLWKWLLALPRPGTGLRDAWHAGYGMEKLRRDILAGLTIGIVAVPLSMALAIATGVAPQYGLYTAIIAGTVIALSGGSRFNISGPTAAFVVILFPIVQQFGLGGLLVATFMAGLILVVMGLARLGGLIQYVPYPVVLGFTAGIAVVIATLQIPDFFGLELGQMSQHYLDNLGMIISGLGGINPLELGIGTFTLILMLLWPRLRIPVPAPLVGLVVAALAAWLLARWFGLEVETIASRFTWQAGELSGQGIPPIAPGFILPWQLPGPGGEPLVINGDLIRALLGPAFAIAMLAAIESLLCAVIADGMTRTRHDPNAELIGQGLGNMVVPFFGGITATAAIARTATNIRSGAVSPVAALVHALVVLLAVVIIAGLLGMVPMAALAALLFIVAWNMAEARHFLHTLRTAPSGDVAVLLTCFGLTVIVDMVLAVAVGMALAAALFIRSIANLSETSRRDTCAEAKALPKDVVIYDINGPLFFAVAEKALASLRVVDPEVSTVIIDLHDVPSMDGTAITALCGLSEEMARHNVALVFSGLSARQVLKLRRAGIRTQRGKLGFCSTLHQACARVKRWRKEDGQA